MKSNCRRLALASAWLLFWIVGCQKAEPVLPPSPGGPQANSLCGLPLTDLHQTVMRSEPGTPAIEFPGLVGSFQIDNMGSDQPKKCTFELFGPHVGPGTVFSRYGRKDEGRVELAQKSPGRVLVSYTIPGRSYGLISVEPPVQVPRDPTRFTQAGIAYLVTGGVLLRVDRGLPLLRSLGPATKVELHNPAPAPMEVDFHLDNTSDRLSQVVLTGLEQGQVRRLGPLRLHVTGTLSAGAKASLVLEPRALERPWSFVFGGDVKQELGTFLQLLEQVRLEHDPLFLIGAGDYTRNSLPQELAAYLERTADLPFPIYPVKGNHELRAQGERHYPRLFGPDRFAFEVDGALFVILDATDYARQGDKTGFRLGEKQRAWLDGLLTDHRDRPLKFLALHAPPHPLHGDSLRPDYPANMLPSEAVRLIDLAYRHQVSYILSGHAHLYARAAKEGTVYLTSGGGGAKLYSHNPLPGFSIDTRKHMMVLTVSASGVAEDRVTLPRPPKP